MPEYDLFNQPIRKVEVLHQKENNVTSQSNLEANRPHFSNQCKRVYCALMRGIIIDWTYGKNFPDIIVDAQRRCRDLDAAGIQLTKIWIKPTNRKILNYFMTPEQIAFNIEKFGLEL